MAYILLLKILCGELGCLTIIGDKSKELMGYDDGHLSKKGAAYVATQFSRDFFYKN